MKYKILKNESVEELEKEVNKSIQEGWFPTGGLATDSLPNVCFYMQAMIKESE